MIHARKRLPVVPGDIGDQKHLRRREPNDGPGMKEIERVLMVVRHADELSNVVKKRGDFQDQPAFRIQIMNGPGLIEDLQRDSGYCGSVLLIKGVLPSQLKC